VKMNEMLNQDKIKKDSILLSFLF
jgi:hypothetical protein